MASAFDGYFAVTAASQEAVSSQLPGRENGPADAYRHLLWAAELTRRFGEEIAGSILDAHEIEGNVGQSPQTPEAEAMDSHNNEVGIEIGKQASDWSDVVNRARAAIDQVAENGPGYEGGPVWLSEDEWRKNPKRESDPTQDAPLNWPIPDWEHGTVPSSYEYPYGDPVVAFDPNFWNPFAPLPFWPLPPPPPPDDGDPPSSPFGNDGSQAPVPYIPPAHDEFGAASGMISPLVLDLDGDGIELTTLSDSGSFFDLDADGFAEQTGWVGSDDGLLTLDRNGDGHINDITELFGSAVSNGFVFLQDLDDNDDGLIDSHDTQFNALRVWRDADQDGVSQTWELESLQSLGIANLSLASIAVNQTLNGNLLSDLSTYTRTDGTQNELGDVWFANDQINTKHVGAYQFNWRVLWLPELRGYGTIPNLSIAMSEDPELIEIVHDFTRLSLNDVATFDAQVETIMYRWAGVEAVAPSSRGAYVDARHLEFLEKYFDTDFSQTGVGSNPRWNAGADIEG